MPEKLLKEIRDNLKFAIEQEEDNRTAAEEDMRFENGEQWPESVQTERESDGRPCLVINKTSAVVKQILGDAKQNKIAIKVRPNDSEADPMVAEVFNGIIRNIENESNAASCYQNAHSCAVRGGFGYFRVITEYSDDDTFEQDIRIKRIVNPFTVYMDPESEEPDGSDAKWCFVAERILRTRFKEMYPGKDVTESLQIGEGELEDWVSDKYVRIVEYFKVETRKETIYMLEDGRTTKGTPEIYEGMEHFGGVPVKSSREKDCKYIKWYKTNGLHILEQSEWAGKYIPIIPVVGDEVWINGKRILRSAIRWAKDPNRLYNWARSTSVETMAMAPKQPFLATPEEIEGHEEQWKVAHKKPMPYLLHNMTQLGRPTRQQSSIPDTGAIQEAMMSADDVKATTGLFDASLGDAGNETSGRAITARQRQGNIATYVFTDNLVTSIKYLGRILIDLIPKIYDTDRVVRLLNKDGSEGWARINAEYTDPVSGRTTKINDLSVGKYDLVVTTGPSYSTQRLEAADGMIQLAQVAPHYIPVIAPRLARNLDWPDADDIAEEMRALGQAPEPSEAQIMAQKLELAEKQTKILELQAKIEEIKSKTELTESQIAKTDHETAQIIEETKQEKTQ